jgi:O-antigen ligase
MTAVAAPPPRRPPPAEPGGPPRRAELALQILVAALLLVLWLAIIPPSGGYFPRDWYPAALGSVLLFGVIAIARGGAVPAPRAARIALCLFAALVVWAFLSLTWAGSPGDAWEAANKLVLFLAVGWAVALVPWNRATATLLLGAWAVGVAVFCAARLNVWLDTSDLSKFLDPSSGRFNDPLGYPNASAALPAMALVPAIAISSIRAAPPAARAVALPVAVFLAEFAVLPQSRGAVVGAAAALAVLVALSGDRIRLCLRLVVIAALVAPAVGPLLDVGNAGIDEQPVAGLLDDAAGTMAVTVALAAVAGVLLALLDGRWHASAALERRFALAGVALVLVVGAGGLVAFSGKVADVAESAWTPGQGTDEGSRLLSAGTHERPDYARVAYDLFTDRPLAGAGIGNFGREYDARRRFEKHSRYAHNLGLRAMSELGLVGVLLLGGLLVALVTGSLARWRGLARAERTLVAACLAVGAYLLAHGMFDWVEEFPALVLPAVGFGFVALALAAGPPPPPARRRQAAGSPWAGRLVAAGVVVMVAGVLLSLVPPYFAVRYTERARGAPPAAAFADLERAADADPLSIDALIVEGTLAQGVDQPARARAAFTRALERERHWYAYLQLALLDAQAGRFGAAERQLAAASALSAKDPLIAEARRRIGRRERVDPARVNESARDSPLFRRPRVP